jgi:hypothetical protein
MENAIESTSSQIGESQGRMCTVKRCWDSEVRKRKWCEVLCLDATFPKSKAWAVPAATPALLLRNVGRPNNSVIQ